MKKIAAILLVLLMGATLFAACGEKAPAETFEIALVTDVGNIDDKSFNEASWNGVKEYAEENNKTYAYYRPTEDSQAARVESIGTAIENGAKVVVCPGYLFETALYEVQKQYPETMFILIDGEPNDGDFTHEGGLPVYETAPNVHCILYQEEQAGYLAGYAAVKDGYRQLGFLGGMAVPAVIRYGYGYVQGAEAAANELGLAAGDVNIKYWYCGGFGPTDEIKVKMAGWYSEGTEVVFACGGSIYSSAIAAAQEANGKVIGVDKDQSPESELIITSAMKQLTPSVKIALSELYANGGTWPEASAGKTAKLGAAEDCVGLPTSESAWRFNSYTVAEYEALFEQIKSGALTIDDNSEPDVKPTTTLCVVDYQQ